MLSRDGPLKTWSKAVREDHIAWRSIILMVTSEMSCDDDDDEVALPPLHGIKLCKNTLQGK